MITINVGTVAKNGVKNIVYRATKAIQKLCKIKGQMPEEISKELKKAEKS
jgi:hypothetical protein